MKKKNKLLLKDIKLFETKFSIKISKLNNDILNLKYPNSEIKQIKTDLYNSGLELLEEIQNQIIADSRDMVYDLIYKKIILPNNLLIIMKLKLEIQ